MTQLVWQMLPGFPGGHLGRKSREEMLDREATVLTQNGRLQQIEAADRADTNQAGEAEDDERVGPDSQQGQPYQNRHASRHSAKRERGNLGSRIVPPGGPDNSEAHPRSDEVIQRYRTDDSNRDSNQPKAASDQAAKHHSEGIDAISEGALLQLTGGAVEAIGHQVHVPEHDCGREDLKRQNCRTPLRSQHDEDDLGGGDHHQRSQWCAHQAEHRSSCEVRGSKPGGIPLQAGHDGEEHFGDNAGEVCHRDHHQLERSTVIPERLDTEDPAHYEIVALAGAIVEDSRQRKTPSEPEKFADLRPYPGGLWMRLQDHQDGGSEKALAQSAAHQRPHSETGEGQPERRYGVAYGKGPYLDPHQPAPGEMSLRQAFGDEAGVCQDERKTEAPDDGDQSLITKNAAGQRCSNPDQGGGKDSDENGRGEAGSDETGSEFYPLDQGSPDTELRKHRGQADVHRRQPHKTVVSRRQQPCENGRDDDLAGPGYKRAGVLGAEAAEGGAEERGFSGSSDHKLIFHARRRIAMKNHHGMAAAFFTTG